MLWIVTDPAADLPGYVVEQFGINVVSGRVSFDGEVFRTGPDLLNTDFLARWRESGQMPPVTEPAVNDLGQVYQAILNEHPAADIISIHASSAMSEVAQRARVAAAACNPTQIHVVDSMSMSIGVGLLVREAAAMAQQRRSAQAIMDVVNRMRSTMQGYMVTENLDYLIRSGSVSAVDRMIGGLLSVKPILVFDNGKLKVHDQRRSRAEALQTMSDSVVKAGFAHSGMRIGIAHCFCEDEAPLLAKEIAGALKPETLLVTEFGPGTATIGGPGALAAFWTAPR